MYDSFELKLKNGSLMKGCKWIKKGSKKNVVIITGMAESSYRYDEFALALNKEGYSVFCLDHYGQGLNCEKPEELGVWPEDGFAKAVEMVYEEVCYVKKETGNPVYLFGHSMGSFVNQEFIQLHGNEIEKTVICGSNASMGLLTKLGGMIANSHCKKGRDTYRDVQLNKMSFGSYNKRIKPLKTEFDWLSTNDESNKKYIDDFRCGYICTPGFYAEFMKGLNRIHIEKNVARVPAKLPIFLVAGEEDPVGNYGKGVMKKYNQYKKHNLNVKVKLYKGMRHEILNEIGREEVIKDIINFYAE